MSYKLGGVIWNNDGTMTTDELTPLEAFERNKLGQLEDLEETFEADFGIPLIILNFKTPIYVKNAATKKIVKTTLAGVDLLGRTISVYEEDNRNNWFDKILFSNYGFTWALTKEELL